MNKTGFGFLRLPRVDADDETSVNYDILNAMVDEFLAAGGDYFDTAYTYLRGASEEAIRASVVERHPRHAFRLADKLPGYAFFSREDCRRCFEISAKRCGVDWFDVYLLHGLNGENYGFAQKYDQFGFLSELKAEGKARSIGFSYHDSPELLERILTDHPEVDYVQLQINYLDWNSPAIQAKRCYDVAVRHGKRVIVMEPVKGGSLAAPPAEAAALLPQDESPAAQAIRFATDLKAVEIVLSGMNSMEQLRDNMRDFPPLTDPERKTLEAAAKIIRGNTAVGCTACGYCTPGCPMGIPIPKFLALYNEYARSPGEDWKMEYLYNDLTRAFAPASACVGCGQCVRRCPQKLDIPAHLSALAKVFEPKENP